VAARSTPALDLLARSGVDHVVHRYSPAERHGRERDERPRYGEAAAAALGVDPARVCKTLIVAIEDRLVVAVVPVAAELDLRAIAAAAGGRRAVLADPASAARAAGSAIGAISPLGLRRALPVVVDRAAAALERVLVSAGRRGVQVELAPADLVRLTGARVASIASRG
jgi:Cys-tRNA(Pro)/Cys-tRNA(Cys) deacylase